MEIKISNQEDENILMINGDTFEADYALTTPCQGCYFDSFGEAIRWPVNEPSCCLHRYVKCHAEDRKDGRYIIWKKIEKK